jgi:hypothetical protein
MVHCETRKAPRLLLSSRGAELQWRSCGTVAAAVCAKFVGRESHFARPSFDRADFFCETVRRCTKIVASISLHQSAFVRCAPAIMEGLPP